MEERMKGIEQKNDGYRIFCKNILNAVCGKGGINQSKFSRLITINTEKAFFRQ
jgi:hypothetical protein